jgi:hypothetical protein
MQYHTSPRTAEPGLQASLSIRITQIRCRMTAVWQMQAAILQLHITMQQTALMQPAQLRRLQC